MFAAQRIARLAQRLLRREEGQDLIEYALLTSFLAMASVVALQLLGPTVSNFYTALAGRF